MSKHCFSFETTEALLNMTRSPKVSWIRILLCVTLVAAVEGHFIQYNYQVVKNGQTLTGTLRGAYVEQSQYDCSLR